MLANAAFKLATATAALVAARTVRSVARRGWKRTTGQAPPTDPTDPEVSWSTALAWGVTVGALAGVGRIVAHRLSSGAWRQVTGSAPPQLRAVPSEAA